MSRQRTVQLGVICERLGVRERDARYVLERGFVPKGVEVSPDSGNYRQFGPGQAFWLGMVLKLKQFGIAAPLSVRIADYAQQSLRTVTQNLGWEWALNPSLGRFDTEHRYFLELAASEGAGPEYIRFGSDAKPSSRSQVEFFDWHRIDKPGDPVKDLWPCVILRLDLSSICRLLARDFGK